MEVLRTPDERFAAVPDFPYEPSYVTFDDGDGGTLRMAVTDVGRLGGEVVVLLHGEPSWSFLWRRVIPVLVDAGLRVVAPDLIGFGRSDKPVDRAAHSYAAHVGWVRRALFDGLGLQDVTLVGQDWGGLIGLRLLAEDPDRFARVVVANTGLPTGDEPMSEAFLAWQRFARESPRFDVGRVVANGCVTPLPPEVVAAYDAPFPDESYTAGPRALPALVPTTPDDPAAAANRAAWEVLARVGRTVPHGLLRRRPDHRRRRRGLPAGGARGPGAAARDAGRRRALPAGGRRAAARSGRWPTWSPPRPRR